MLSSTTSVGRIMSLKNLYTNLILQQNGSSNTGRSVIDSKLEKLFESLINGYYLEYLRNETVSDKLFQNHSVLSLTQRYIMDSSFSQAQYFENLVSLFESNINTLDISKEEKQTYLFLTAVLLLQFFVEINFSGPQLPFETEDKEVGFLNILGSEARKNCAFQTKLQSESLSLLTIGGFAPYHLTESPFLLALALFIFEQLQGPEISLFDPTKIYLETSTLVAKSFNPEIFSNDNSNNFVLGSICWWRARALQVQQSLLSDISPELTSLSLNLISKKVVNSLIDESNVNSEINQKLLITYYLENANISIAGDLELQTLDNIINANKISGMQLVLTGCKAKMTKHQQKSTATLTVLAKSDERLLKYEQAEKLFNPQDVKLNDDLFLERPEFDTTGNDDSLEENEDPESAKRIKIDYTNISGFENSSSSISKKLLPIAMKESDIPKELSELDPNNQPNLANLDHIQLLLRMQTILNNTPSGNSLVNEELIAIIQRILFSAENSVNWLVFARALWYRSLLEAARPRTVERGVLQLYSLVEELGVASEQTARLFPKTEDEINFPVKFRKADDINQPLTNAIRLRFIYLIPLMPKWSLDSKLAEKLLELGALKSALEIYERLEKWTDAALCYASTGDSNKGIQLINKALEIDPNDARSWSVLGDIKQNPELWQKAWEIGRYASAKRSLAKYYYNPPKGAGIERDIQIAINHMYDCLSANPINFQNWYFYGCMGLEISNYELAAEAFTRCISLDDTNSYAWSNLASALIKLDKLPEAFNALQKSVNSGDSATKSWKIWENYLIVAVKLGRWDDVLHASVVLLNRKKELDQQEASIDLPVVEKLVDLLVSEPYDETNRETYFQKTCIDFVCNQVPSVVLHDARVWRIIAKVDLWRRKPWLALEDYEKAYRAVISNPDLSSDEKVWNEAVETCCDLVSAYENFGEMEGRHGAGDVVCKDWRFKAKSTVRSLLSKGKASWEYTDSYERLLELKKEVIKA